MASPKFRATWNEFEKNLAGALPMMPRDLVAIIHIYYPQVTTCSTPYLCGMDGDYLTHARACAKGWCCWYCGGFMAFTSDGDHRDPNCMIFKRGQ